MLCIAATRFGRHSWRCVFETPPCWSCRHEDGRTCATATSLASLHRFPRRRASCRNSQAVAMLQAQLPCSRSVSKRPVYGQLAAAALALERGIRYRAAIRFVSALGHICASQEVVYLNYSASRRNLEADEYVNTTSNHNYLVRPEHHHPLELCGAGSCAEYNGLEWQTH